MKKILAVSTLAIAMSTTLTGCFTTLSQAGYGTGVMVNAMTGEKLPEKPNMAATVALDAVTLPLQLPFLIYYVATDSSSAVYSSTSSTSKTSNITYVKYPYTNIPSYFTGNKEYEDEYLALKKKFDTYVDNHYYPNNYKAYYKNCTKTSNVEVNKCFHFALSQIGKNKPTDATTILSTMCDAGLSDESCFVLGTIKLYGYKLIRYNIITNVDENKLPKDPAKLLVSYITSLSDSIKNNSAGTNSIDDKMNLDSIDLKSSTEIFTKLCKNEDTEISYLSCASLKEIEYATSDKFENKEDLNIFLKDINDYIQNPDYANSFSILKDAESRKTENEGSGYYFRYADYKSNEYIKNHYYEQ